MVLLVVLFAALVPATSAQAERPVYPRAALAAGDLHADSAALMVQRIADSVVQRYRMQTRAEEEAASRRMSALYLLARPVKELGSFMQTQFFTTPVFFMLCALVIIWVILIAQSRRLREHAREMQERVSELSAELVSARQKFETEISEHKELISNLNESEQRYRSIFETTGTATVIIEDDATISMVNSEFEKLTGYARSEIEGFAKWTKIVHPDDVPWMRRYDDQRRTDPGSVPRTSEFRFITRDGQTREGYMYVSMIPGTKRSVVSFFDITVRKRVEKESLLLAHALRSVSDCVSICDMDDRILFVNEAFLTTYGYAREEIIGKHSSILRLADDTTHVREDTVNGGWTGQLLNRRKDGSIFSIELSTSVVRDDAGAPVAYMGVARDITERLAVEHRIRFQADILQNVRDCVVVTDLSGKIIYWNDGAAALFGYSSDEMIGREPTVLSTNEQQKPFQDALVEIMGGRCDFSGEWRGCRKGGAHVWVDMKTALMKDADGRLSGMIAVAKDITERREAEEALRRSTENYKSLFENNVTGVFRARIDGRILECNAAFARMLGYETPAELLEIDARSLYVEPEERDRFLDDLKREGTLAATELLLKKRDGTPTWILESARLMGDDTLLGTIADINLRKATEHALLESETRYRELFESNPLPMWVHDIATRQVLAVNDAAVAHYGYDEREFLSMVIDQINDPDQAAANVGEKAGSQRVHRRKDGTRITVELTSHKLVWAGRDAQIVLSNDITERLKTQVQLTRFTEELQQLNAGKDKFFSIISHDLRSPLSTLHGYTDLLIHDIDGFSRETIKSIAGSMNALTKRVHTLLENLLEWSRIQSGRIEYSPSRTSMHDLVQEVVDLLQESALRKSISIRNSVGTDIVASIDKRMIRSVTQNLLSNAVKFSRAGGTVDVTARRNGSFVYVSVNDQGIGMTEEEVSKLFRIDVQHSTPGTAEEQGSGLGLILCKELVERNNGTITAESAAGAGTSMTFTVPIWRETVPQIA